MVTTHNFLQKTLDAALSFGLLIPANQLLTDGQIYRVATTNSKGQKDGYYVLHEMHGGHYCGVIGMWREGGRQIKYRSWDGEIMHHDTRNNLNKISVEKIQRAIEKIAEKQQQCIEDSIKLWESASREGTSDYLVKKQIKPYGARFKDGLIIVPVHDIDLNIKGLQKISVDKKLFETGTAKKGNGFLIGQIPEEPWKVFFCEGYATGASLHEAVSLPVVVCFDAGNLEPVVKEYKDRYPLHEFIICADDDKYGESNAGIEKANYTADLYGCRVVSPVFNNEESKPTDFNDLAVLEGLPEVKHQVMGLDRVILQDCELPIKHLGELCALIESKGAMINRTATIQGAIAFICHAVSNRAISSTGEKSNMFLANACQTIHNLNYVNDGIEELFYLLNNNTDSVITHRMTAISQISDYFRDAKKKCMLFMPPNLGSVIKSATRQPTQVNTIILETLSEVARKSRYKFIDSKGKSVIVQNPAVSIYANFSDSDLWYFAKASDNCEFFGLFLSQEVSDKDFKPNKGQRIADFDSDCYKSFREHCITTLNGGESQSNGLLGSVKVANESINPVILKWQREPFYYEHNLRECLKDDDSKYIPLTLQLIKALSVNIAYWNGERDVIPASITDACYKYVLYRVNAIIEVINIKSSDDVSSSVKDRVLDTIYKFKDDGIQESVLMRRCSLYRKMTPDEREELIQQLINDGRIEKKESKKKNGYSYVYKN